jgi:hypothetical protein
MTTRQLRRLACAPIVTATLLVAVYTVAEVLGGRPLTDRPLNLAEAVADDDPPAVMRQLSAGMSPLERYDVGGDILQRPHGRMTPLEAAAVRDRSGIMELLLRHGVPLDAETRGRLLCLAGRVHARDVIALLERPGAGPRCDEQADAVLPALPE